MSKTRLIKIKRNSESQILRTKNDFIVKIFILLPHNELEWFWCQKAAFELYPETFPSRFPVKEIHLLIISLQTHSI